jgi:hypothetical protein
MLRYDAIAFDYEPFPIGLARPVLDPTDYEEMVRHWPPLALFKSKESLGIKYSLSQVNHPLRYGRFVRATPIWRRFHRFVKSGDFGRGVLDMLRAHHIDLGLPAPSLATRLGLRARALWRGSPQPHFPRMKARFEFSAMPAAGGSIRPHTDALTKIVTVVIPMLREGEWNERWGGGTSIVRPKDRTRIFNLVNEFREFDEVECLKTFPFEPNQGIVFVKTFNSWHAVWPIAGDDPDVLRKTLTINLEIGGLAVMPHAGRARAAGY